ncbi:AAA family ATPase [uncultured Paraglaciecola sp.]|uniref:AAA family ATPase n=1 Tax=uncultured Paraglaciecola sp. TaxID=1765024 RepID=UPI0026151CAF|nr:AAA family ATPase [uncultured Paraglaciecola sp.]
MKSVEEEIILNGKSKSPYYKSVGKEVAVFKHSYEQKLPFLLKGPTGTGKSRFIEFMAHKLHKNLITVSCHEETSSTDLIGRYIIKGAETDIIPDESGISYLKVVEAGNNGSHNHFLEDGKTSKLHNVLVSLNKHQDGAINITNTEAGLFINSPFEGEYMTMATRAQGKLIKDSLQPLILRSRYVIGDMQLVFPKPVVKGVFDVVKKPVILKNDEDGIVIDVTVNGETKKVNLSRFNSI